MASYRGHLTFSTALGAAYGGVAAWQLGIDWAPAVLAGGLTSLGGLLPDLDSDSGVPVRELFGLAAALTPLLLVRRLELMGLPVERMLVVLAGIYLLIRYGASALFKRITVHRGMFHSIPAMLIAGLVVFLLYHDPRPEMRLFLAGGVMAGFLSHLVLDELCSVNLAGVAPQLNKFAGSALKFWSASWPATLMTYALLAGLLWVATHGTPGLNELNDKWRAWRPTVHIGVTGAGEATR
jgi:membrane-bound metal-dependent hydrolase YbcI (DUF457 family)